MRHLKACITLILLCATLLTQGMQVFGTSAVSNVSLVILDAGICKLNIKTYPEKRIPRTGNWGTLLIITVSKDGNKIATSQARSDDQGIAHFDFCVQNLTFQPGKYDLAVKGLSHLCKSFLGVSTFENDTTLTDLTGNNQVLLAGETSNIFDDKINSLDASTQIRAFYKTDDEKNDLNRDGKVNSLDFSNTVYNFYKLGDGVCR
jgi:hypothetical protein